MNRLTGGARLLVMVLAAGFVTVGCGTGRADESVPDLETATVSRADLVASVAATGTIEPIRVIDVKSQASGEVREVGVELGDKVERGTLLVRIDPRDVRNAWDQAVADLDVAEARHTVAQRQLERTSALRDSQVVTADEYERALLEEANAKAALVKAETNLELAEDRLNDVTVRAPITGTVVEKGVEEGQIVTSTREVTGGTVLMRMADLNEVQVRTFVDETDIGKIRPGLEAQIRVEAYPDREFRGSVLQIEPQAIVEQGVTMFAVLTRIRNDEDLLKPGMNADVEMVVGSSSNVLALQNGALKTIEEASELVRILGMDPKLLDARIEVERPQTDSAAAQPAVEHGESDGRPSMAQIQAMTREERMQFIQGLPPAERQAMFARFQEMRERQQADLRANPNRPRPAFVFRHDSTGVLTLSPVLIGLSTWQETEIVAGLDEGATAVKIPLSLVQQEEFASRIRGWVQSSVISRNESQ